MYSFVQVYSFVRIKKCPHVSVKTSSVVSAVHLRERLFHVHKLRELYYKNNNMIYNN